MENSANLQRFKHLHPQSWLEQLQQLDLEWLSSQALLEVLQKSKQQLAANLPSRGYPVVLIKAVENF